MQPHKTKQRRQTDRQTVKRFIKSIVKRRGKTRQKMIGVKLICVSSKKKG